MTPPVKLADGAQWVHPDAAQEALDGLWPSGDVVDLRWYVVREAVSLLDHIARHPAGTEDILRQVRLYRRAVRAADRAGGAP